MAWEVWNLWAVRTSISYSFRMPDIVSIKSRNTKEREAIYGRQHLRRKQPSELTIIISLLALSAIPKNTTGWATTFAPFRNNKPKHVVNRRVDIWKLTSASIWGNHRLEKRISDTLKVPDISLSPLRCSSVHLLGVPTCRWLQQDSQRVPSSARKIYHRCIGRRSLRYVVRLGTW